MSKLECYRTVDVLRGQMRTFDTGYEQQRLDEERKTSAATNSTVKRVWRKKNREWESSVLIVTDSDAA